VEWSSQPPSDFCFVAVMRANVEPNDPPLLFDTERAIATVDAHRPEPTNLFEMKGGMTRVSSPKVERLPCASLSAWREAIKPFPEFRCGRGTHPGGGTCRRHHPEAHVPPLHRKRRLERLLRRPYPRLARVLPQAKPPTLRIALSRVLRLRAQFRLTNSHFEDN